MKEDFLHYVWKYQKFIDFNLHSSGGEKIEIVKVGTPNINSGPDFLNSYIIIEGLLWVGNVEIHLNSSDWYAHHHEKDANYDNVILHVVWQHDVEVFRKDKTKIPTLELKKIVSKNSLDKYHYLFSKTKNWINCEKEIKNIDSFLLNNWLERLFFERLEAKYSTFEKEIKKDKSHWEKLLFTMLCKNFGLKVNGESFLSIAKSLPFSLIQKNKESNNLEALLYGQARFFENKIDDNYFKDLKELYLFLASKYNLKPIGVISPKYFRLRPSNFPTIRLSQFAELYKNKPNLFSQIIDAKTLQEFYSVFNVTASVYWDTHYNFGVSSTKHKKKLTKKFIHLLLINTILPLKYSYAKQIGKDISEEILELSLAIPKEENTVINKFQKLGINLKSALKSQALLQLKNDYCIKNKCLQCAIGNSIIKGV